MEDETLEHLFAGAALQGGGRGRMPPYDFSSDKKKRQKEEKNKKKEEEEEGRGCEKRGM